MPLNKSKATRSAFAGYGFSRWKKLVTFWWFRINVWCLINPVWRKSILFLNLFDLSILYFDYLHVLLGLIVITTTRFEQFMNNHDLLLRPGQSSHHIHKMNIQKREIRKLKFKFLETRWIPKVTEFTSQRKTTSLWCN